MREFFKNKDIRLGMASAFPIIVGYLPIAMAFGILSKTSGISLVESFMFSAFVFAGSSQFMALNLLNLGAGVGEIVFTTLLVNFRHFLMSAALTEKLEDTKGWVSLIAFGITDEVFSVASFREGKVTKEYILSLEVFSYSAWVGGTLLGYLIGAILPQTLQDSMGIGIYAMFIALLLPMAKKSKKIAFVAILSGLTNTLLTYFEILPQGWNIIVSILLISGVGLLLEGKEEISYE